MLLYVVYKSTSLTDVMLLAASQDVLLFNQLTQLFTILYDQWMSTVVYCILEFQLVSEILLPLTDLCVDTRRSKLGKNSRGVAEG